MLDARGLSLENFVNRFIKKGKGKDWIVESKRLISVNGVKGYGVEVRFGGMVRYGNLTFLLKNGNIFLFDLTAGVVCDAPISEFDAYGRNKKGT